jgi:transcription initiation factor IIE alpha subunit
MKIIDFIPCGIENAISQDELATRAELDKRELRRVIHAARCAGAIICSTCDGPAGGYYIPASPDEARPYVLMQKSRIASARLAVKPVEDFMRPGGDGSG